MNAGMCDMNDWVEAGGGWRSLEEAGAGASH